MSSSGFRVGIFLGYAPDQGIIDQGIGRLLGFLIEGVISQSADADSISIACPAWYVPQVRELLSDLRIPESAVKLVVTDGIPYILRIRGLSIRLLGWRHGRPQRASGWNDRAKGLGFWVGQSLLGTTSTISFLAQGLLLLLVGLLAGLLALPVVLIAMLISRARRTVVKVAARIGARHRVFQKVAAYASSPLRELRRDEFASRVYEAIRKRELERLVRKINRGNLADVWYCPTIFWPEFAAITGPKVVAVPDMVFVDFPLVYANRWGEDVFQKTQQIIRAETHLVCYSDYVRDAHLVDRLGVAPDRVSVIRHGLVEMQHYAPVAPLPDRRQWAIHTLNSYIRARYRENAYLAEFDFSDVRFALYASQARPHKNLLQLARAWEVLLRKHYCGAKLVLTCMLSHAPEVNEFIQARRLQFDILELNGLPAEILAALNVLATVAVNPSLFEGGFPFTFSEAYSVGTPSVMSRIPAVLEMVQDEELRAAMLFDPYDKQSIVDRVRFALANRDRLLQMQAPLYEGMARRNWGVAASEYVRLFSTLAADA